MKKYERDSSFFLDHVDVGDYESARRFLVFFVYLNDVGGWRNRVCQFRLESDS